MRDFWLGADERIRGQLGSYASFVDCEVEEVGSGADAGFVKVRRPEEESTDLPWARVIGAVPTVGQVVLTLFSHTSGRVVITSGGSGGATDHGALTGLADDDHTQYYNQTRGDVRYSQLGHTHAASDVTSGTFAPARLATGTPAAGMYPDGAGAWTTLPSGLSLPFATPQDYGAVADGATDDRAAIQAALDANLFVYFPPGRYVVNGGLTLRDFQVIRGMGTYANSDGTEEVGGPKLIFTGTAGACFSQADTTTSLLHAGISDFSVRATGTYDWIFDLKTLVGFKMSGVRAETNSTTCGGFRAQKINAGDSSWVVNWWDVQIRLPDASTKRTINVDFSDSALVAGNSTGGTGAIFRGTGGVRLIGGRYDRSSGSGITLSVEAEARGQHIISGCEIEENTLNGVLVDGDANDARTETWYMPTITGNYFRNPAGGAADVRFTNATGGVLYGGVVQGNSHTTSATPVAIDHTRWQKVAIGVGAVYAATNNPTSYVGGYRQSPIVLAQSGATISHTGTTAETTLVTIPVPAGAMGPNGRLRITTLWNTSSNTNTKTLRVKLGGQNFLNYILNTTAATVLQARNEVANRNSASAQIALGTAQAGDGASNGLTVGAVDTSAAQDITITALLANSTDAINLQAYMVELIPAQ